MTPEQEDALWDKCTEEEKYSGIERWRLAIRAAVAQERERAAKDVRPLPCDVKVHNTLFRAGVESWQVSAAIERQREYGPTEEAFGSAAAIRRG